MRTEKEFEEYVEELGRRGIAKEKRRKRIIILSASGVAAACLVAVVGIHVIGIGNNRLYEASEQLAAGPVDECIDEADAAGDEVSGNAFGNVSGNAAEGNASEDVSGAAAEGNASEDVSGAAAEGNASENVFGNADKSGMEINNANPAGDETGDESAELQAWREAVIAEGILADADSVSEFAETGETDTGKTDTGKTDVGEEDISLTEADCAIYFRNDGDQVLRYLYADGQYYEITEEKWESLLLLLPQLQE